MDLRHCVIPAAGLGTRFLPATKALPKELLPVLDRPLIQWGVEEAVAAGADQMVVVLGPGKELIREHFTPHPALERALTERGRQADLDAVRACDHLATFEWVFQPDPRGLGDAVARAATTVGDHPFLCLLPDDLSVATPPVLRQLRDAYDQLATPILALMRVPKTLISRYGCATVAESRGRLHRITAVVEKPDAEDAASDLAVMGRYVLPPEIFEVLSRTPPGVQGEVQLTDAIGTLIQTRDVWGLEFEGSLLDVGTPEGWLQTNIRLAATHPTLRNALAGATA